MEIITIFKNKEKPIYTVEFENEKLVDVKVVESTGLIYIMQNEDGSMVYTLEKSQYKTFPDYVFNEQDITNLIIAYRERERMKRVKFVFQISMYPITVCRRIFLTNMKTASTFLVINYGSLHMIFGIHIGRNYNGENNLRRQVEESSGLLRIT